MLKDGFTLKDLYDERAPLYEKAADFTVELTGNSIETSAEAVYNAVFDEISVLIYNRTV